MVWFQCEDCGDNLKKPKLLNHFRVCSANKLSCIDCGQMFGQESVQGHTQCITETEKYGPKGQGKALNDTTPKPNNNKKQKPDVDINVGLSERPPWFCSLCNTSATSKQTLLLHADGKKHRAKARAFHASKQQPIQTEEATPNTEVQTENNRENESSGNKIVDVSKEPRAAEVVPAHNSSEGRKRKLDGAKQKTGGDLSELGSGEVIQVGKAETEETKLHVKKAKHKVAEEDKLTESNSSKEGKKKIKWKKLISSVLKCSPESVLKMRKLRKLVLQTLRESGYAEDENQLIDILEHKINSSSRFTVDGKYVRLVANS